MSVTKLLFLALASSAVLTFAGSSTPAGAHPSGEGSIITGSQLGSPATGHGPSNGHSNGIYWHSEDTTISYPSGDSLSIRANFTSNKPGWNTSWQGGSGSKSGVKGYVVNSCSYDIYVHTTLGESTNLNPVIGPLDDPTDTTATYTIASGDTYETTIQAAVNGNAGVSIKLSTDATQASSDVYQVEFSQVQNSEGVMEVWYDLSAVNGDPFIGVPRFLQVGNPQDDCQTVYNAPDSTAQDYPFTGDCSSVDDLWFYLC